MRRIALGIMREWRTSGIRSYVLTSVRKAETLIWRLRWPTNLAIWACVRWQSRQA